MQTMVNFDHKLCNGTKIPGRDVSHQVGQRVKTVLQKCVSVYLLSKLICGFMVSCALFFSTSFLAIAASDMSVPEVDTATRQLSESGRYEVSFDSVAGPIEINSIHEWRLTVMSAEGMPVDGLTIDVEGGMPDHNHGLPTAPRVTESLGEGQYRVEGFKFQMPGHWTVTFNITDDVDEGDSVTFNLVL